MNSFNNEDNGLGPVNISLPAFVFLVKVRLFFVMLVLKALFVRNIVWETLLSQKMFRYFQIGGFSRYYLRKCGKKIDF